MVSGFAGRTHNLTDPLCPQRDLSPDRRGSFISRHATERTSVTS